jgi:hypothetical protein
MTVLVGEYKVTRLVGRVEVLPDGMELGLSARL